MAEIDFEAEGLLEGLEGEAREARLALLRDLTEAGVPLEELKQAVAESRLVLLPAERVFETGGERYSRREIAERAGFELEFLEKLTQALGLPQIDPDEKIDTGTDLEAAVRAKQFLDAGIPPEGLLEVARIIGMGMSQLATADRDLIGDVFIEPGVDERELALRYAAAAETMRPRLIETLRYAHDVHLREAIRQAMVSETERAEGKLEGAEEVTIAFADLVGFTRLGEQLEVEQIGELTDRLFSLAAEVASPPVRLVKMIGDAAMFASREPLHLLEAVTALVEAAASDEMPSLRAGVAAGLALGRGGDWYGRPVNLAARITGFARPDSVVGSDEVKKALKGDSRFDFSFAGRRRFKGIRGEVPVHRIRRREGDGRAG
ncbi:MAG: adenylate cyclase regulatory domain-containing protein [Solirubrobacterales bacterium]